MFPASAGMNLQMAAILILVYMFPASAGMNRDIRPELAFPGNVPRERGDEPNRSHGVKMN